MLRLPRRADERLVEEILDSPNPASLTSWELRIAGEPYGDVEAGKGVKSVTVDCFDEGPALTLEAEIAGHLPISIESADVELDVTMGSLGGSVTIPAFRGKALIPEEDGVNTTIKAASAGYWLDSVKLRVDMPLTGARPDDTAYTVLSQAPYPNVEVAPVGKPLIRRVLDESFTRLNTLDDVLQALEEEARMYVYDRADGTARAGKKPILAKAGNIRYTFTVGEDIRVEDFTHVRTLDNNYSAVRVYRKGEDGSVSILAEVAVPNSKVPPRCYEDIEWTDEDLDPDPPFAIGFRRAEMLAYGERNSDSIEARLVHPLLERGDMVTFEEAGEDVYGEYERTWLAVLTGYKLAFPEKRMTLKTSMGLLRETRGGKLSASSSGFSLTELSGSTQKVRSYTRRV